MKISQNLMFYFKKEKSVALLASLCFLIHLIPDQLPSYRLLCSAWWAGELFSTAKWQMLSFVSRGHWKATAGGKDALPSVLLFLLALWPLLG